MKRVNLRYNIFSRLTLICVLTISMGIVLSSCSKDPVPPKGGELTQLPVVFHVLYKDKTDKKQYVDASRLKTIVDNVNRFYRRSQVSVDMKIEFVLAQTAPAGKTLTAPGVEYVDWTKSYPEEAYPIDCDVIMDSQDDHRYVKLLWDPNEYINILLYNFTADDSGSTTLGLSFLPYTYKGNNAIGGLYEIDATYLTLENLDYAYCLSINSLSIYDDTPPSLYSGGNVNNTLAHELGHYLGLYHTFAQDAEGKMLENTTDTDYCLDTPSYDRVKYSRSIMKEYNEGVPTKNWNFPYMVNRTSGTGTFVSRNIMDYEVTYADQFTADQQKRVKYVLANALLMPRKSKASDRSRAPEGILDIPVRIIR